MTSKLPQFIIHDVSAESEPISLPNRSKSRYEKSFKMFSAWRLEKGITGCDENIMMTYFHEKSKLWKSSSLWSTYSMLKSTLQFHENIDISNYKRVTTFLKRSNDNYVPKKSKILSMQNIEKFVNEASDELYLLMKVVLIFGLYGACRKIELYNLTTKDILDNGSIAIVTLHDTKTSKKRLFTVTSECNGYVLYKKYASMRPSHTEHSKFFIYYNNNKCTTQPVGINTLGIIPKKIAEYLNLDDHESYTGHCFRRTSATLLVDSVVDINVLKRHSGCQPSNIAESYVEKNVQDKVGTSKILSEHDYSTSILKHLETTQPNECTRAMTRQEKRQRIDTSDNTQCKKTTSKLMEACVRLITIHGRPMSLIEDKAFRDIIDMIPQTLRTEVISSHTVRDKITMEANTVRNKIANEIEGKLICVKVDAATCMKRSFLSVNIQFVKSTKLHIRTLGVIELLHRHCTTKYLKDVIIQTCQEFHISNKQIYAIIVANGDNKLKTVRLLNEEKEKANTEDVIRPLPFLDIEIDIKEENSTSMNAGEYSEYYNNITTITCAAHTLQLSISDFLKREEIATIVEKARTIAKQLCTPINRSTLPLVMFKKHEILDCSTRWNSTLDMLQKLHEVKEYCDQADDENLKLPQTTWNKINEIIIVLMPSKVAAKKLQSEQLFIGDLYEILERCIIQTGKIENEYAAVLVNNMKSREEKLFENAVFISGIFMDPRYKVILTESMNQVAKTFLLQIYGRIQEIANTFTTESNSSSEDNNLDEDEFEKMLKNAESIRTVYHNNTLQNKSLENEIDAYLKESRLKSSSDLLDYWNTKKNKIPKLYELSKIILAISPTQVSVDRLFSALKFILNPERSLMTSDILDDILLIRTNIENLDDFC